MLKELVLRRAVAADAAAIAAVHNDAFGIPQGAGRSVEAQLVHQLQADGDALDELSIVADRAGDIVGAVTCSRGRIGEVPAVALGPIGVRTDLQRRGIGAALMSSVIVTADQFGEPAILVLGDPAYYEEFHFEPASGMGVTSAAGYDEHHFMIRTLQAWRPEMAGVFHYPAAFENC